MSTAAVMLVKDEADIIGYTAEHLMAQVDHLYVADNNSTDGTREILEELADNGKVTVIDDREVGYWQSRKTTDLARLAFGQGHTWVVPCDADEYWYVTTGGTIAELLATLSGVQIVRVPLYNHLPTSRDPEDAVNPLIRIGYRKRDPQDIKFGKVACRLRPDLTIEAGNHGATTNGTGTTIEAPLCIRHYSWRTPGQYVRKIRNGAHAYSETNLPIDIGNHWRTWDDKADEAISDHFFEWFFSARPETDETLIFDPAPGTKDTT